MTIKGHLVMMCIPGWGHIRPLVVLACRIMQRKPEIGITILTFGPIIKQAEEEFSKILLTEHELTNNFRVLSIFEPNKMWESITDAPSACLYFMESMWRQDNVKCLLSGRIFQPWPKPKVVISDTCLDIVNGIRSIDPAITVLGSIPDNNSYSLRAWGPEDLGGVGDIAAKALLNAEQTGNPIKEIENHLLNFKDGTLIQVPGLPPIYDYELSSQPRLLGAEDIEILFVKIGYRFMREADGVVTAGTSAFEAEALAALKKWQLSLGKEVYIVGPLLSINDMPKECQRTTSDEVSEIHEFLERNLREHGEHSLIYISFGSFLWPDVNQICGVIDVLIEERVPFIYVYGSQLVAASDRIIKKATGWFLSHCGHSSVTESLAEGVPLIAWPIMFDQPFNAALISIALNVGYQLTEARTGDVGLKALKRGVQPTGTVDAIQLEIREILRNSREADGKLKRKNAEVIKDKMKAAWKEGGEAMLDPRIGNKGLLLDHETEPELLSLIETREEQLQVFYDANYAGKAVSRSASIATIVPGSPEKIDFTARYSRRQPADARNVLQEFFSLIPEGFLKSDPVRWWGRRTTLFPNLSRLARDILSIPGSAVAVERIFSGGRDRISLRRASLKPETIRILMLVKQTIRLHRD
ncbi:glycosyltransferase family 1 protein [Sphaerobolus stellatus SS14]|uniref:Glycosyltransferase family 1 protein n=1 Tax=Sphaerobolus stellatus (strain SS14) TaxID=990650 RepID=A0A0C9TM57_SPHS4|nr:glycosyltransferase family 1 protein [Sphaerobolus stellatus SS14]